MGSTVFDPIILQGRKPLVTLGDAAQYITTLPKAERDAEEWQAAMASAIAGRRTQRATDVRPNWCDASVEPPRRTRVRSVAERQALGKARLTGPSPTCVGERTDKLLRLGFNCGEQDPANTLDHRGIRLEQRLYLI
jgi:hypothetical protein